MAKQLTSEEAERLKHLKSLRETYQRNVDHYEKTASKYAGEDNLPPYMMHDLRSNREKLLEVTAEIARLMGELVSITPASAPEVRSPLPAPKIRKVSPMQRVELAKLLLHCQSMKNQGSRTTIINLLEDFSNNVLRDSNPLNDVLNLVNTCLDHENGVETLLDVVRSFEGKALPMQNVDAYWQNL